ncbi:hypothetical protein QDY66_11870, partial [Kingella negevensis]
CSKHLTYLKAFKHKAFSDFNQPFCPLTPHLQIWFEQDANSQHFSQTVAQQFKQGNFSNQGAKKYALLVFLQGAEKQAQLNLPQLFV